MPLHPDLEAFLELAHAPSAGRRPMHEMPAPQARAAYDAATLALDTPGPDVSVETLALPSRDGSQLPARLYMGHVARPAPTLLFFHGGGYVLGGLESHSSLCRDLAQRTPCAVLAVDYRLAPEHKFPIAFHDAEDASVWLLEHGPAHGLDAGLVAFGGDSVGGTLATALAIAARDAGRPQPAAQLLLYPCTSVRQDSASHRRYARRHLLEAETLQWMFRQYLRSDHDRTDWRFAPLAAADLSGLASAHVFLAEFDPLVDEGVAYAERLASAGVPVALKIYEGMVHDFARLGNIVGEADQLRADVAAALGAAFARASVGRGKHADRAGAYVDAVSAPR